jgi:hypothetical protein
MRPPTPSLHLIAALAAIDAGGATTAPADAAAASYLTPASGPAAYFTVKGSDGYHIDYYAENGVTTVSIAGDESKPDFGGVTDYVAFSGEAGARRTHLDLRRFGGATVLFRPTGKVRRHPAPRNCEGGPAVTRHGVFVGRIRFHGEGGYAEVEARRARGFLEYTPQRTCKAPAKRHRKRKKRGHKQRRGPLATTFAVTNGSSGLSFSAVNSTAEPTATFYLATVLSRREGIAVSRHATAFGDGDSFSFDRGLDNATISPPAPFAGSATFPGLADVPLTGRDFGWGLSSKWERRSSVAAFSFGSGRAGTSQQIRSAAPSPPLGATPGSPGRGSGGTRRARRARRCRRGRARGSGGCGPPRRSGGRRRPWSRGRRRSA